MCLPAIVTHSSDFLLAFFSELLGQQTLKLMGKKILFLPVLFSTSLNFVLGSQRGDSSSVCLCVIEYPQCFLQCARNQKHNDKGDRSYSLPGATHPSKSFWDEWMILMQQLKKAYLLGTSWCLGGDKGKNHLPDIMLVQVKMCTGQFSF